MAGRKPKPTRLKELTGNPGKRKLNDREPKPAALAAAPPAPDLLGPVGRAEWERAAPILVNTRVVTVADVSVLTAMCKSWELYVGYLEDLEENGAYVTGARGGLIAHPAAKLSRDALAEYLRMATEFGMTPSSRSRIKVPDDAGDDDEAARAERLLGPLRLIPGGKGASKAPAKKAKKRRTAKRSTKASSGKKGRPSKKR